MVVVTDAWKKPEGITDEQWQGRLDAWGLDDAPDSIERFKPKRGDTVHVQFRMDARVHHSLMVILGSQLDPSIETLSDIFNDGTAKFLDDWTLRFADGPTGRLLRWWTLERRKQQREARKHFLEMVDSEIRDATDEKDRRTLSACLDSLYGEREDTADFVPPSYIEELDKRIAKIESELKR